MFCENFHQGCDNISCLFWPPPVYKPKLSLNPVKIFSFFLFSSLPNFRPKLVESSEDFFYWPSPGFRRNTVVIISLRIPCINFSFRPCWSSLSLLMPWGTLAASCCNSSDCQRWSPRERPWPRGRPRGHILKSLALASKVKSLALA